MSPDTKKLLDNIILPLSRLFHYIYATSVDYDPRMEASVAFFKTVQNKMHWAAHGQTAAEKIFCSADAEKEHMGLTAWKDAPDGKIQKFDVAVAKNYLSEFEIGELQRLVSAYLDIAESMELNFRVMSEAVATFRECAAIREVNQFFQARNLMRCYTMYIIPIIT